MNSHTREAHRWLAQQQSHMTADLIELANQNSGSTHFEGLLSVADWLEDWFDVRETSFQRVHLPPRRMVNDAGDELAFESPPALRWDFHPERERRVLLAIHYDTVFAADSPFQVCELQSPDMLQGPGVADAKGGIVILRNALRALAEFGLCSGCGWSVILNPDEEIGSPSSAELFESIAGEFDFGLLFEPSFPNGALVSERKGSGNYDIVVRGRSAHSGRHFDEGRNALALLCGLLTRLDALNGQRTGTTINVGAVRGGTAVNIVPDLAIGRLNLRITDAASGQWFSQQLQQLVDQANVREGYRVQVFGGITSPPKRLCDGMRVLMQAVEESALTVGEQAVQWSFSGGACDGNKLASAGLPNIDTLGPVGRGLHSSEESMLPQSLVHKSQLVVELMSRFSAGEYAELAKPRLE